MPDVALIDNFQVLMDSGVHGAYTWSPKAAPLPTPVQQQLRQAYYAAVSYIDEQVGILLNTLNEMQVADNTIVVFTADHGYHLGERGEWEKKANFELTTRVPLLIAAPHLPGSHGKHTRVWCSSLFISNASLATNHI
jgi:iduronate 2-sulfatase